jgi:hypothetical protein
MSEQTKFEKQFIKDVVNYCVKFETSPHLICKSFGYNNSVKINDFINGNGAISSRTMGQMIEFMNKDKPMTGKEWLSKQPCVINSKRIMPFKTK